MASSFAMLVSKETSKPFPDRRGSGRRPNEVSVDIVSMLEPGGSSSSPQAWQQPGCEDIPGEAPRAMLELNFEVGRDHVTLTSVTPSSTSSSCLEHCEIGNGYDARGRSNSFRESMKSVGTLVKQFSHDFTRNPRNGSKVQDADNTPGMSSSGIDPPDPELAKCASIRMQKNPSRAEYAIEGLRYISQATATADQKKSWEQVEARFHKLADSDFMLPRSCFAECIGMKESKEFANELYDAAVRRKRSEKAQSISKGELYQYWLQITDASFDARMQMFFAL